jgi:hypothetical protein
MAEVFGLIDAHVALWTELFEAAAGGDRDARRVLLETWHPMIESIEVLMPLVERRRGRDLDPTDRT